jgi:hypothetical protein
LGLAMDGVCSLGDTSMENKDEYVIVIPFGKKEEAQELLDALALEEICIVGWVQKYIDPIKNQSRAG